MSNAAVQIMAVSTQLSQFAPKPKTAVLENPSSPNKVPNDDVAAVRSERAVQRNKLTSYLLQLGDHLNGKQIANIYHVSH